MNAEEQGAADYRALADKLDRQPGPANLLREAVHKTDVAIADWLTSLAEKIAVDRGLYWRGTITTSDYQTRLDDVLAEMNQVALLLKIRPIAVHEVKR